MTVRICLGTLILNSNIMKKFYPWIPILGVFLTVRYHSHETGLDNDAVFFGSALLQALYFASPLFWLLFG